MRMAKLILISTVVLYSFVSSASVDLNWTRDPFKLPELDRSPSSIKTIACPKSLILEGVMEDDTAAQAFISGGIYSAGEGVDGFRISKISKEQVVLISSKYQCFLKIGAG